MSQSSIHRSPSRSSAARRRRAGFTLVEMLVTIVVTLVVMLALVNVFEWVGNRVAMGRAVIEMSGSLRSTSHRLQLDLDGLTVQVRPWQGPESAGGYFEIVERAEHDLSWMAANNPTAYPSIIGDRDDILAFTSRSTGTPFVGRLGGNATVSSLDAEVLWWAQTPDLNGNFVFDPEENMVVLHRRALMIRPDLNQGANGEWLRLPTAYTGAASYGSGQEALIANHLTQLYQENDVSFRLEVQVSGSSLVILAKANSLSDLTKRENRWLRQSFVFMGGSYPTLDATSLSLGTAPLQIPPSPAALVARYPYALDLNPNSVTGLGWMPLGPKNAPAGGSPTISYAGFRQGEDVMLGNILAFDVRVYDPTVPVQNHQGQAVVPRDPGYGAVGNTFLGVGRYVDLNHGVVASTFSGAPTTRSGLASANSATYDTWSTHYEQNGIDEDDALDGNAGPDQGVNGLDDDAVAGTDDPGERETAPPYPVPLRGIQIRIRVYEPDTRQVRQTTVTANFVPD